MANYLLVLITVVCVLSPFILVAMAGSNENPTKAAQANILIYKYIKKLILISTPAWFPVLYIGLWLLEIEIRKSNAFTFGRSNLGVYLLYAVPVAWAIAICRNSKFTLLLSIVLIPPLFVVGILTTGIIGWMGCDALNLCH